MRFICGSADQSVCDGLSRSRDEEIFALAVAENRMIVTADLDFSRILALSGRDGPGLILFRVGNITDQQMRSLLEAVLQRVAADRLRRSVVVVDGRRMRIAPLPLRPDLRA